MKKTLVILSLLFTIFSACKKDKDEPTPVTPTPAPSTHYGSETNIGDGTGKTFYTVSHAGVPLEVGVVFTADALNNLSGSSQMFSMPYHANVSASGYTHVLVGWNPNGHPPSGVYGAPHFDFHFYKGMTEAERMMITAGNTAQFANIPDSIYHPSDYLKDLYGVPLMGLHWTDELAPEFNGGQFTKTFIYGSYDGKFVFYEPMITIDHFLTAPNEKIAIRQPANVQETGYYPSHYNIRYSATTNEYIVSIDLVRVVE
ncbi:MAG: hypothetical protein ACR2GN_05435 [Bacteroidia bacterium]